MNIFNKPVLRTALVLLLASTTAGCLTVTPPSDPPPSYETLSSTAARTSTIGGMEVAVVMDGSRFEVLMPTINGTMIHDTDATIITSTAPDGTELYTLTDPDGLNDTGHLEDGTTSIRTVRLLDENDEQLYQYVALHWTNWQRDMGEPASYSFGVFGMVTAEADMPSGGVATYNGTVGGDIWVNSVWTKLRGGNPEIIADFGAGLMDITMADFRVTDGADNPTTTPVDTFTLDDMVISGNSFSGGDLAMTLEGTPVLLLGANPNVLAGGNFFGYDGVNDIPAEIGGILYADDGRGNYIWLGFLAK